MPPCFMYGRPAPPHMELHYSSTRNLLNPSTSASAALEQLSYGARHGGEDQAGPEGGDPGEGRGVLLLPAQGGQGGGAQPRRRAADVRRPAPRVCPRTHRRGEAGAGLWQGGEEEEDAPWRPRRQGRQGRRGRRPRQGGGERGGAAAAPSDRDGEEEPAGPSEARPPVLGLRGPGHHGRGGHQGRAQGGEYETKARGKRHRQAARALGEGVYRIVKHDAPGGRGARAHTHLVYKLELPSPSADGGAGEPQEAMNVEPEASFLVQIKNPEQGGGGGRGGGFGGLQGKRKAAYPEHLQGRFGSSRYAPADPPDLLNYEGCELLLISASDDVEEELGLELQTETENETETETEREGRAGAGCSDLVKMFGEVADVKPLLTGSWD